MYYLALIHNNWFDYTEMTKLKCSFFGNGKVHFFRNGNGIIDVKKDLKNSNLYSPAENVKNVIGDVVASCLNFD